MKLDNQPVMYWSEQHKAYTPDLNRCPSCGGTLAVGGGTGQAYCLDDHCEVAVAFVIKEDILKLYFKD